MGLPCRLRVLDALLQNVFCFFDGLSVQVNGVPVNSAYGIVLPEDVIRSLFVVLIRQCAMSFTLFRELVGACAISSLVRVMGLWIASVW